MFGRALHLAKLRVRDFIRISESSKDVTVWNIEGKWYQVKLLSQVSELRVLHQSTHSKILRDDRRNHRNYGADVFDIFMDIA